MTYQVYALKTRPQTFAEVIGQDPIVSALTHALDKNKLHHAYLFTGTRGVGKTTIARIIAKSLNCEQGVSSNPCNKCNNCLSISEGKFPDLIEIDAASRTKVEDTRALLDTVIYSPTQGRYKIYLIDEVHMLSTHSFNALLKTLEEPPSHVKFLLATTDPQKIPATIVSRCLQFTLKWVDSKVIVKHLENILAKDGIDFEPAALNLLAVAAQGSVRDSLSLLEQAVSLGADKVTADIVRTMLGSIAGEDILTILKYIIAKDSEALLNKVYALTMLGADFSQVLTQLIYSLHQIAIMQQAPNVADELDIELISEFKAVSQQIKPEDLQIYYQIALLAKRDLPYSPQPKLALEMALIRMLNFVPVDLSSNKPISNTKTLSPRPSSQRAEPKGEVKQHNYQHKSLAQRPPEVNITTAAIKEPAAVAPPSVTIAKAVEATSLANTPNARNTNNTVNASSNAYSNSNTVNNNLELPSKSNWHNWVKKLNLTGILLQIIKNTQFTSFNNNKLTVILDSRVKALVNQKRFDDIENKISQLLNNRIKLEVNNNSKNNQQDSSKVTTPAGIEREQKEQKHEELVAKLQVDPNIENIMKTFDGELKLDSVEVTEDS